MATREEVAALAEVGRWCLARSLDARVPAAERLRCLELGERINDRAAELAARRFDASKAGFDAARKGLADAVASVKKQQEDLAALADTLDKVGKAVAAADGLLGLVL